MLNNIFQLVTQGLTKLLGGVQTSVNWNFLGGGYFWVGWELASFRRLQYGKALFCTASDEKLDESLGSRLDGNSHST